MRVIVSIMTITLGQLLIEYALYELKAHLSVVLQFGRFSIYGYLYCMQLYNIHLMTRYNIKYTGLSVRKTRLDLQPYH